MKQCKQCKQIKPFDDFHNLSKKRAHLGDGHVARCKECEKTYKKSPEYRKSQNERQKLRLRFDPEFAFRKRKKDKKYAQTEHGKKVHAAASRTYNQTPKGKVAAKRARKKYQQTQKFKKAIENYRLNNSEKRNANIIFSNAIKLGKIKRPPTCSICNIQCVPEGHHPNYSKPLEVVWTCKECHTGIHWS